MPINRSTKATAQARAARKRPSVAEKIMWSIVRDSKLGFKFKREHPIDRYRLDFYCHEAMLAVELDGEQHNPAKDAERDAILAEYGILVFRIPNVQFFNLTEEQAPDFVAELIQICETRANRKAL